MASLTASHLNFLNILVRLRPIVVRMSIVSADEHDRCGNMEYNGINDDHPLRSFVDSLVCWSKDNSKSRVQYKALAGDHHNPSYGCDLSGHQRRNVEAVFRRRASVPALGIYLRLHLRFDLLIGSIRSFDTTHQLNRRI